MYLVTVRFDGNSYKDYNYVSKQKLEVGQKYDITTTTGRTYDNYVTVISVKDMPRNTTYTYAEIGKAVPIRGPRPDDMIEKVIFNEEKLTTVVLWKDGVRTIVHCQEGDAFDKEKGLAMCYVKRFMQNRGCFNEIFKKYCPVEDIAKNTKEEIPERRITTTYLGNVKGVKRDPTRIKPTCDRLSEIWSIYPNLRLGQLLENTVDMAGLYYMEDEELISRLNSFYARDCTPDD